MRFSEFLRSHADDILAAWDEFAATVTHVGKNLDHQALRDHAEQILSTIAADLDKPQSDADQEAKSRGEVEGASTETTSAAAHHADARIDAGFSIDAMITEYRALRASVLRLWTANRKLEGAGPDELEQVTRFNEAIDQAITESVARYTEKIDAAANLFMGVLGHDIRNPLGTIRLSAEIMLRSGSAEPKVLQRVVNSVSRIQYLIDLMVDYSRAQSSSPMPLVRKPGRLDEQCRKIVEETDGRHPGRQLTFKADGDFSGEWDEGRMGQLLSNLLENALLYGARDEAVSVTMRSTADGVELRVRNAGPEIPKADRERIFEPRTRGASEQRAAAGLGFGLYICREIASAHGGSIHVESSAEAGTTFIVTLPRHA